MDSIKNKDNDIPRLDIWETEQNNTSCPTIYQSPIQEALAE